MAHYPFKQLEYHAADRAAEAAKIVAPDPNYPRHINLPDGSYRVANDADQEKQLLDALATQE